MSVTLSGKLPKDERNGLGAISAALQDDPESAHVVLLLVNCSKITTDMDTGDILPTARIVAVEAWAGTTADAKGLARMLTQKFEQRTGLTALPLEDLGLGDDPLAPGNIVGTVAGLMDEALQDAKERLAKHDITASVEDGAS